MTEVKAIRSRRLSPRGYHRQRPQPFAPVAFHLEGHLFETSNRDLWVTPSGMDRAERIKVTRLSTSRSAHMGYPSALILPKTSVGYTESEWRTLAGVWISWRGTTDYLKFPKVHLDRWARKQDSSGSYACGGMHVATSEQEENATG